MIHIYMYTHGKNGSIACLSFKCFSLPKPCAHECGHSNKYSYIYIYNSKFDLEHILLSLLISTSSGCSFLPVAWWGGRERGAPRTRAQKTITQANIAILSLQLKSWPSMNPWSLLPIVYPVLPFGRTALASMCLAREDCRSGASFMGVWLWDAMGCYGIVCQSRGDCSLMQFETWRNTTAIGAFELLWLFYPSWWLSSASWRA